MQQLLGTYGNLLIPAAVILLAVIVLVKIAIALEHAVIRVATSILTLLVVGTALLAGSSAIGRLHGIQSAADAAARSVAAPSATSSMPAAALQQDVERNARQALVSVGLNPAYLRVRVTCAATGATLHLRYSDASFLGGLLSRQEFSAPLPPTVRCR